MSVQNTSQTSVFLGRQGGRKTAFDCSTVIRDESYPVLAVFIYFERNPVLTVVVEVYTKTN
jgi:hypothetical protein